MGYIGLPITQDGIDWASFEFHDQFPHAIQERVWTAQDSPQWPRPSHVWSSGIVDSIVANGSGGSYTITHSDDGTTGSRWFGYTGHSPTPANYDLIFDDRTNPAVCIHVKITGTSTSTTLVVDSTADHILLDVAAGGFLDSPNYDITHVLSSLVGRNYYIIQRGGIWWSERWLQWPNDQESWVSLTLAAGAYQPVTTLTSSGSTATAVVPGHQLIDGDTITVQGAPAPYAPTGTVTVVDTDTFTYPIAGSTTSPAAGTITVLCAAVGAHDATPNAIGTNGSTAYPAGAWATGHVLMVREATTGYLLRLTLTGNTPDSLLFTRQPRTVSGQYAVMPTYNFFGSPHRSSYRVYSDLNTLCSTNDIGIDTNPLAGPPWRWYHGAWDHYFARHPDDSVGGVKVPATSLTLNDAFGGTFTVPLFGEDVWTDFTDAHNPPDKSYNPDLPRTIWYWQKYLEDLCTFFVQPISYEGMAAIPNFVPATWFQYANIGLNFVGISGSSSGGNLVVSASAPYYPINCYYAIIAADGSVHRSGTGSLIDSTHLSRDTGSFDGSDENKTYYVALGWSRWYEFAFRHMYAKKCWIPTPNAMTGHVVDPPDATHVGSWVTRGASAKYKEHNLIGAADEVSEFRNLTDGDYARYDGDNYWDPSIYDYGNHQALLTSDTSGFAGYWNNFYEGTLSPANQALLLASLSGTVDSSDTMWVGDSAKNWWPGGILHTESGTGNGASSTVELNDTTKAGSQYWLTSVGGMLGNIIKVTIGGVDYYRRIFAHPADGPDVFWTEALPSTANGQAYAIRWPKYEQGRFNGLTLHMVYPDGSLHDVTITAHDDKRMFFTALGAAPPVGTTYTIQGLNFPGGVWKRAGGNWVKPTGNDTRTGANVPWHSSQTENHPFTYKNYGRFNNGDMITKTLYNELFQGLQALTDIPANFDWSSQGSNNIFFGQDTGNIDFSGGTGAFDNAAAAYAGSGTTSNDNPFAESYTISKCAGTSIACYDYAVGRRFAYGVLTLDEPQTRQNCEIDWYVLAYIPNDPTSGGGGTLGENASCPGITVFDANGDGVRLNQYHRFRTDGADNSSTRVSGTALGHSTRPTDIGPAPVDCDATPDGFCEWTQGYVAKLWKAIRRMDVNGGYEYQ